MSIYIHVCIRHPHTHGTRVHTRPRPHPRPRPRPHPPPHPYPRPRPRPSPRPRPRTRPRSPATPKHVRTHTRESKAQQDRECVHDTCLQWNPTGETIPTALIFGVGICLAGVLPGKRRREVAYTRERERTSKQASQWERMRQRSRASKTEERMRESKRKGMQ